MEKKSSGWAVKKEDGCEVREVSTGGKLTGAHEDRLKSVTFS